MNDLERYLDWITDRLEDGTNEEADLELKRSYEVFDERERHALFEVADLLAALSKDPVVDGYRALVLGPANDLVRPDWLSDEATLPDRLQRNFEGAVQPRVEVARRELSDGLVFDALVVVERSEPRMSPARKLVGYGSSARGQPRAAARPLGLSCWRSAPPPAAPGSPSVRSK